MLHRLASRQPGIEPTSKNFRERGVWIEEWLTLHDIGHEQVVWTLLSPGLVGGDKTLRLVTENPGAALGTRPQQRMSPTLFLRRANVGDVAPP